jgi:hypothetical protein
MARSHRWLLSGIALPFAVLMIPTLSHSQSAQPSPLPKAPPEIMSTENRDSSACTKEGFNIERDRKPGRSETTGTSLSERLSDSDGVICPPSGVDPDMRAPTPEGGRMRVITPPASRM